MIPWTRRTAAELVDALEAGHVTSVELTQAHLDRIAAVDPAVHGRADATVAYLTSGTVHRRAAALAGVARSQAAHARPAAPPLTLRVVPGLAAAVDPGGGESFGEHRCRLVAEAVVAGGGLEAVSARLADDGVALSRPWARHGDPALPWER